MQRDGQMIHYPRVILALLSVSALLVALFSFTPSGTKYYWTEGMSYLDDFLYGARKSGLTRNEIESIIGKPNSEMSPDEQSFLSKYHAKHPAFQDFAGFVVYKAKDGFKGLEWKYAVKYDEETIAHIVPYMPIKTYR